MSRQNTLKDKSSASNKRETNGKRNTRHVYGPPIPSISALIYIVTLTGRARETECIAEGIGGARGFDAGSVGAGMAMLASICCSDPFLSHLTICNASLGIISTPHFTMIILQSAF